MRFSHKDERTLAGRDSFLNRRQDLPLPVMGSPVTGLILDMALSSLMTWLLWDTVRVR